MSCLYKTNRKELQVLRPLPIDGLPPLGARYTSAESSSFGVPLCTQKRIDGSKPLPRPQQPRELAKNTAEKSHSCSWLRL